MIIPIKQILTENEFVDQALQNVRAGIGYDDRNGPVGNMTTEQFNVNKDEYEKEARYLAGQALFGNIKSEQEMIDKASSPVVKQMLQTAHDYKTQYPYMTATDIALKLKDDQRLYDIAQANNSALTKGLVDGGVAAGAVGIGAGIGAKTLYDRFRKR